MRQAEGFSFPIIVKINPNIPIEYLYYLNRLYGIEIELDKENKPIKAIFGTIYCDLDALIKEVEKED